MDFIEDILGKLEDWIQRLLDALAGSNRQREPEPIPVPVDERRYR